MSNRLNKKPLILIADKEKPLQRSLSMLLENMGYDVVVVDNGRSVFEAIQEYKNKRPDLLLLDIELPGLSVADLVEYIDNNSITIPYIVTGYVNRENHIDSILSNCSDYLEKPFSAEDIISSVSNVLEKGYM